MSGPNLTGGLQLEPGVNLAGGVNLLGIGCNLEGSLSPSDDHSIPLSWNDPMFTGMTDGGGASMATGQIISRRSTIGADSGLFIFNQVGAAGLSYCRITSTVSNDCDVLVQVADNISTIDHCYIDNNIATNPTETHADGVQLQWLVPGRDTPAGGVVNLRNSMIIIGGDFVTAGFFCADGWHGRINISDCVFQTWAQYGLRLHADVTGNIDLYMQNVYFDTKEFAISGRLLNYGGGVINIMQWDNVRFCTVDNGVLTLGALIPQPIPSSGGTNFG